MKKKGSYRAVYSVLLDDLDFRKLPAEARHIFHVLKLTRLNNVANIFVCGEGELVTISEQTGIPLKGVRKGLRSLVEGLWVAYESPVLWIRNGLKYDPLFVEGNENHKKSVLKALENIPKCALLAKFCQYYDLPLPEGCENVALAKPSDSPSEALPKGCAITDSDSYSDSDNRLQIPITDSDSESTSSGKPDRAPVDDGIPYQEIISHLNQQAGTNYRDSTPKTRELIKHRWKEGFTLNDFKIVHIKKAAGWLGTEFAKFLRPSTLYGPKFESYLNEIPADNRFSETTRHNLNVLNEWLQDKKAQMGVTENAG